MTWDVDLVLMVRVITNDLNGTNRSDEEIQRTLVASCILVQQDIDLAYDYACDINALTITPDPVVVGDMTAQALLPLHAACLINQGDYRCAVSCGAKVRDGDSQVDTTAAFKGYKDILELGPCAGYAALRDSINRGNSPTTSRSGNVGKAVYSPFRKGLGQGAIIGSTVGWYDEFCKTISHRRRR